MSDKEPTPGVLQWKDLPDVGKAWLDGMFKEIQEIEFSGKVCICHNDFGTFRVRAGFANLPAYLFKVWTNPKWNKNNIEYWFLDIQAQVWHYIRVNGPPKEAE